ncbi:MAG: polysaccharide biosynthesis C-terminal domain-containing protein, partial [Bacteroidales bacterium]|nr:polysaccharide biosynthesis C-terminal domain-containing protein [Bacteroidales bacterium]
MAGIKSLFKDTAIYGLSSIIGRFLNWCLVPFYTYTLRASGEYGVVTELYSWTALVIVILTYGMETGFFRFVNKAGEKANQVYSTTLFSLTGTSSLFILLGLLFLPQIAGFMGYDAHPEFVGMMIGIVAVDAFCCIPFAYLRYKNQALKFAGLKLLSIGVNIFMNLFFLWICPKIDAWKPELIAWFYRPDFGVGYVFLANVFSTAITFLALLPVCRVKADFNGKLLKEMLRYSLPLLVLGIAGIMNQSFDKIIFKHLFDDQALAQSQLGIYGACYKIAIIMMMFTQAFRYAYEPFIFAKNKGEDKKTSYVEAMKYYIIFAWFIFLGVMFYIDILKYIISPEYHEGLVVVPIVLICYLFQGVYFNLSLWYKLTDKTQWGAYISLIGCALTIIGNIIFVPRYGYVAAAWTSLVCFLLMTLISWWLGQKYYPIKYDMKSA